MRVTREQLKVLVLSPKAETEPRHPSLVVDQPEPAPGVVMESVDPPSGPQGRDLTQEKEPWSNHCGPSVVLPPLTQGIALGEIG